MTRLIDGPQVHIGLDLRYAHGFFDDFYEYTTGDMWTTIGADGGTATVADDVGGRITLTDATVVDNDEVYIEGKLETFKFAANKPIILEAYLQFTEINVDDANVIVGLVDNVAANTLLDDGGGPKATYSGMVFFKVDGGTVWQCENSIGGTQKTTELTAANSLTKVAVTAGGAAFQRLKIECIPINSTQMDISFYVDDDLVAKHKDQAFASATEMQGCIGLKQGAVTQIETLVVDYFWCYQLR